MTTKRILSILCSAAPFVAGLIAALGARHDMRMLWMAIVATIVVRVVFTVMKGRLGYSVAVMAFVLASIAACGVAIAAGARAPFGVVAVAVVIAAFSTAGAALGVVSSAE